MSLLSRSSSFGAQSVCIISEARKRRFKSAHPRRKITMATIHGGRAKQFKKNRSRFPGQLSKAKAVSEKLARTLEDPAQGGHDLRIVRPDWSQWPTTSKKLRAGTLMTCVQCFRASNDGWDVQCVGRTGKRASAQRGLWIRLTANPDNSNINILLSTWNVSLQEAEQFLKTEDAEGHQRLGGYRGVRVGEASHLGPSDKGKLQPCLCDKFRLRSLNCGGPNGAWAMFADCCQYARPQVIALQETRLSATEEAAFIRNAQRHGFHTRSMAGMLDRGQRPRGGVMLLVDRRLRFRKSACSVSQDAQVASAWIEDLFLLTFYSPPDRSKDCQQQASEQLQECLLSEEIAPFWLAIGDSNEDPTDSYIDYTLRNFQGHLAEQCALQVARFYRARLDPHGATSACH